MAASTDLALVIDAFSRELLPGLGRADDRGNGARGLVGEHGTEADDDVLDVPGGEPAFLVEGREGGADVLVDVKASIGSVELNVRRFHRILVREHDHPVEEPTLERRVGRPCDREVNVGDVLWVRIGPKED